MTFQKMQKRRDGEQVVFSGWGRGRKEKKKTIKETHKEISREMELFCMEVLWW